MSKRTQHSRPETLDETAANTTLSFTGRSSGRRSSWALW